MAPYGLSGHDKHGLATTKREDFLISRNDWIVCAGADIVIVHKQFKNHFRLTGADQRFIGRIGNALDAIELIVLQARNAWRCPSGNNSFQKPCDRNVLLQKPADRKWIF